MKKIGLAIFIISFTFFVILLSLGEYKITKDTLKAGAPNQYDYAVQTESFNENEEKIYLKESLRAIGQLPEKEREVMLYMMKQYPIESNDPSVVSISSILGCTPKTVQNRLKSARSKIKKMSGEE